MFSTPSETVVPFGLPGPPAVSATRPGDSEFEVTFASANENGRPITQYNFSGPARVVSQTDSQVVLECTNNLGNPCIPQIADTQTPRTPCLQNAQTVRIEGWAVNEAGDGERSEWTIDLSGCPPTPGINNTSAGDGEYTVGWTRPAGSNIWVESNGTFMGPFNDNQNPRTFSGVNGTTYTLHIWACNQFGCSTSASRTVTPEAVEPSISILWGTNVGNAPGCDNEQCFEIRYEMRDFPPNQSFQIECRTVDEGLSFTNTSPTTNSAGSASGETTCYFGKVFADDKGGAFLRITGTDSNRLPA